MDRSEYTDIPFLIAKYILKCNGVWFTMNAVKDRLQWVALIVLLYAGLSGMYVFWDAIHHYWGIDTGRVMYFVTNIVILGMAVIKVLVLLIHTFELQDALKYAERHFCRYYYEPQEKLIFAQCQKFCKMWITLAVIVPPVSVFGYTITPIVHNIVGNKSDRQLIFEMWTEFPVYETPYFEIVFVWQAVSVFVLCIAYVCPDSSLCLLCVHAIFQFRMLQHKLSNCLVTVQKDTTQYLDHCVAAMKECVEQHQSLIFFCNMIEHVFTMVIFCHMVVFSISVGLSGYQILMPESTTANRAFFMFHVMGSCTHLAGFCYFCNGLMTESSQICNTIYFASWNTLPMNKKGRTLRLNAGIIMLRAMKPCCLTAGGFFPVSLESATSLFSTTFSYFTLMRERFSRDDSQ